MERAAVEGVASRTLAGDESRFRIMFALTLDSVDQANMT